MTDAISSIQLRIAEIQRQFNIAPAPPKVAPATSAAGASDFAAILAEATAATATPADLKAYGNGRIPESALVSIGGGDKLAPPAAKKFLEMRADAAKAGVSFGVNDSYRSYDEQVDMARRKGIYGQGGLAAVPGRSNHGLGISVDLELNGTSQQWMKNNANRYGWVNDVAGEPWHWTYKG